jgi:hypothetical protein
MSRRLALLLIVLAAPVFGTGVAVAQDRPGECVTRRVTGPGGAYRWERVECDSQGGWGDFDRWGYGRRLDVETGPRDPAAGDRYGDGRRPGPAWEPDGYRGYRRYPVAGVDEDGYLVWPGKRP